MGSVAECYQGKSEHKGRSIIIIHSNQQKKKLKKVNRALRFSRQ
jgi:hypothetical protein